VLPMSDPATIFALVKLGRWWHRVRPIQTFRENRMFKGKLTYGSLAAVLTVVLAQILGDGVVTQADLKEVTEAVLVLVAVYGRWRATKV
jgi:hypothetical protein